MYFAVKTEDSDLLVNQQAVRQERHSPVNNRLTINSLEDLWSTWPSSNLE